MPQLFAFVIFVFIAVWVVAAVVWVVQWIAATLLLIFQIVVFPLIVFVGPTLISLILIAAMSRGGYIAAANYMGALNANVETQGLAGKVTGKYIISVLSIFLIALCLFTALGSIYFLIEPILEFANFVEEHFDSIRYPGFRIKFPFWD